MKSMVTILGTLLLSLTANAWPQDTNIFNTLTAVGVATDLSASSQSKILSVGSIECTKMADSTECLVDDASNRGLQRTIAGNDAKLVSDLLVSIFHARPVFETTDSELFVVKDLHCAQLNKLSTSPDNQTSCYAKVWVKKSQLDWGNPLDFQKLVLEK